VFVSIFTGEARHGERRGAAETPQVAPWRADFGAAWLIAG
jgi:hypothetical protein